MTALTLALRRAAASVRTLTASAHAVAGSWAVPRMRAGLLGLQAAVEASSSRGAHGTARYASGRQNCRYDATVCHTTETVVMTFPNGEEMLFPFVWLRDNCRCSNCFHPDSQSRIIDLQSFDIHSKPSHVHFSDGELHIFWQDKHASHYKVEWLQEHSFNTEAQEQYLRSVYRLPRETWSAGQFKEILTRFKFRDVLYSDTVLYDWLVTLATYGVSIIEDVPAEKTSVRRLAERVAFIRKTHYGEEFSIQNKPGTTNRAYLSANLQLHTDLPYYSYKPGANLLHCLVQTECNGGSNLLADGLAVAQWLKENYRDAYNTLTQTAVDWNDIGEEDGNQFHKIHRAPVICEDMFGEVCRINFSQPQRDSHLSVPLDAVRPWYEAMDMFTKAILSQHFCVPYKMKEGEIVTFDNIRLVHGRRMYEDTGNKVRHAIGGFLDWDEIWSRVRVLKSNRTAM